MASDDVPLRRSFPLKGSMLGNDSLQPVKCFISPLTCDLCFRFLEDYLSRQAYQYPASRWMYLEFGTDSTERRYVFRHYSTLRALQQSSRNGCQLCNVIVHSPNPSRTLPMVLASRDLGSDGRTGYNAPGELDLDEFSEFLVRPLDKSPTSIGPKDYEYQFVLANDEEECLQIRRNIGDGRSPVCWPSNRTDSPVCFNRVKAWLSTCTQKHEKCPRPSLPQPKRLLDLAHPKLSQDSIRLTDSSDLAKASYVALSYKWGNINDHETASINLAKRLTKIPITDLPAVIRDAVYVTRECDIRFMWVDALCICQDDKEEWNKESNAMADVYGGSIFTISALSSSNVHDGFLRDRSFQTIQIGTASVSYGSWQEELTLFIRRTPRNVWREFEFGALNRRAWAFQERLLAPAVLHYGRDQMMWECNQDRISSEIGLAVRPRHDIFRLSDVEGVAVKSGYRGLWDCIVRFPLNKT